MYTALLLLALSLATFDSCHGIHSVTFVDQTRNQPFTNYLFRGSRPTNDSMFFMGEMRSALTDAATAAGFVLPSSYYIIDVSLVTIMNLQEYIHLSIEYSYFESHSNEGELFFRETIGQFDNATLIKNNNPQLFKRILMDLPAWQQDHLGERVDFLYSLLMSAPPATDPRPRLIYYHCEAGHDRTGEISGSYYMKYKNLSYFQATSLNTRIAGRPIYPESQLAMQWYCYYLKEIEQLASVGECQ
eukprot:TRINITY_DN6661_c0_g1_i1.p1 TRINITY_DN6661_c0_g1~~TRINITY_DN6661_c0_g1_i1.p1  ORF type:complete len:244 (+),score=41.55 TRINITY_DN6661_c0_g1_i1:57-788(+)